MAPVPGGSGPKKSMKSMMPPVKKAALPKAKEMIKPKFPIKLYYFDVMARAEPIRMMLNYAGLVWEDVRCTSEDFAKMKAGGKLDFGSMPILEIDNMTLCQT